MKYGLGIDTGGTYTDAVIYDFENKQVVKSAKSVTIKENLTLGINNTLNQLPLEMLKEVKLVSLSTTLATNACVEGKGGRALLVLIGCDEDIVTKHGPKYGLPPSGEIIFLSGGHNQQGEPVTEPDWNYLEQKIQEYKDRTDSYGIVELWGIRNNEFEEKARVLIRTWTDAPVVCAHDLTGEINSLKRAASTLLNAQLIPLINDFLSAVKASMDTLAIRAPLVIVRGDGSLMSEEFAREKPVETLLSGPSASVAGGMTLSGKKDCIIVDMGGTTSDIAIVKDGTAKLAYEGVNVGSWKTGTRSIQISTVGLGGDSLISYNNSNELTVGPIRVAPLSWLAGRWPEVLEHIRLLYECKKRHTRSLCEFFYLIRDISADSYYTEEEKKVVEILKCGPKSITALAEAVDSSIYSIKLKRLEQHGVIMKSALTPTDIMHLTGDFSGWNAEAARYGAMFMAYQLDMELDELVNRVNRGVKEKLFFSIVKLLMENENEDMIKEGVTKQFFDLVMSGYAENKAESSYEGTGKGYIRCRFSTDFELVGIGAPIHIYLPDVARVLDTQCVIPENASVANALGAITGKVTVEETVILRPKYDVYGITGYMVYSSSEPREFAYYEEALEHARAEAVRLARETAAARGSGDVDIFVDIQDNSVALSGYYSDELTKESTDNTSPDGSPAAKKDNRLLLETIITARAMGTLKWL